MDITNDLEKKETEIIEKKVLAYMFHDKKYVAASIGKISKDIMPNYYNLYGILLSYFNKYKDVISDKMLELYFNKKNIESDIIITYKTLISQLRAEANFTDGEFKALVDELIEKNKRQQMLVVAEKIVNTNPINCNSNDFAKLQESVKSIVIKSTTSSDEVKNEGSVKDSVKQRLERYKEVKENPEILKFIPTGFKHIDDENGGFRPGELVYIIGRKGDGKSVLLLNLAHNMWLAGHNVIIFSLEISKEDYERRFDARAAEISSNGLKMGRLSEDEEKRYKEYLIKMSKGLSIDGKPTGTLYIVDTPPGITPAFVDSKVDTIEQLMDIKFDAIITDYAGIMQPTIQQSEKRHQQGQIALDQKVIARSRDCVVISAAQKSRAGAKEKNSDSSFVAESDQVADHIDWGIDIASVSEEYGCIQSFKTRDSAPFKFSFKKQYNKFKIQELDEDIDSWDQLS